MDAIKMFATEKARFVGNMAEIRTLYGLLAHSIKSRCGQTISTIHIDDGVTRTSVSSTSIYISAPGYRGLSDSLVSTEHWEITLTGLRAYNRALEKIDIDTLERAWEDEQ